MKDRQPVSQPARIITWVLLAGVAATVSLYALFGHALIRAMYLGESWGPLNRIIRSTLPLEHYFSVGDWYVSGFAVFAVAGWILLTLIIDSSRIDAALAKMRKSRLVSFLIGGAIIIGLLVIRWKPDPLIPVYLLLSWLALGTVFLGFIKDSAVDRGGRAFAWSLFAVLSVFCLYFLATDTTLLNNMFAEDTFGENISVLFLAFSGFVFLYLVTRMRSPSGRIEWEKYIFYLLFGLMFLFGAAEEISWGQRIIGFDTPEGWPNRQDEANLHNLFNKDPNKFFSLSNLLVTLLMVICGLVIPVANRVSSSARDFLRRINFPVLSTAAAIFMIFGAAIHTEALHSYYVETDEIRELFMSCGFLVFALERLKAYRSRAIRFVSR